MSHKHKFDFYFKKLYQIINYKARICREGHLLDKVLMMAGPMQAKFTGKFQPSLKMVMLTHAQHRLPNIQVSSDDGQQ